MRKEKFKDSIPILILQVLTIQGGFYIFYDCKKESSLDIDDYNERECTNDTRSGFSFIRDGSSKWQPEFITKLMKSLDIETLNDFNHYLAENIFGYTFSNCIRELYEPKIRWVSKTLKGVKFSHEVRI